jgi:hypothetical protein
MSSPFAANEPWRRQQPDYAELTSTKLLMSGVKRPMPHMTRHNPEPGMLALMPDPA